jgi:lipoprotein-anchoring transpeptidase ErfK/SrfK
VRVLTSGHLVPGVLSNGGMQWQAQWPLQPSAHYTVTAAAVNSAGRPTAASAAFGTLTPGAVMTASSNVSDGDVVGAGEPIVIQFDHPVADEAAAERAITLETSVPVTGAWAWFGRQELDFRPQAYWPAHTQVYVDAHFAGLAATDGAYATANLAVRYSIGDSQVAIADTRTHRLRYYLNGRLLWNWPMSSGADRIDPITGASLATENGTFLAIYKANPVIMSSASTGITGGPDFFPPTPVYEAVNFTPSGDYVHSAPWSVGEQGFQNVSHGCVNLSPDDATLFYDRSQIGDIVQVTGSPVRATTQDQTDWMYSWSTWLSRGAPRGEMVSADLQGSYEYAPVPGVVPPHMRGF